MQYSTVIECYVSNTLYLPNNLKNYGTMIYTSYKLNKSYGQFMVISDILSFYFVCQVISIYSLRF